ncbi:MAG: peptidoglycan editing factor PgeF [Lachnospiraceae bacterium]|nr:peptidoglycan editing factor PgeF [Lachnospiraceae bacterium]
MIKNLNDETYIETQDDVPVIRFKAFENLNWLNCGFSTRLGGVSSGPLESLNLGFERGDQRENVVENFKRFAASAGFDVNRICLPRQWHTNNIRVSSGEAALGDISMYKANLTGKYDETCPSGNTSQTNDHGNDKVSETVFGNGTGISSISVKISGMDQFPEEERLKTAIDGQITDEPGLVLIAYGADCTPVYLADMKHHAVGLVHSGWKGTLNSISADALRLMNERYGTKPEDVIAVIGPSISSDAYEVGFDVAQLFIRKHQIEVTEDSNIVRLGRRVNEGQKYQLDLWEANRRNLLDSGVFPVNIHVSGLCTFKEEELFYSHRRTGNARGVMAGFMMIR